MIAMRAYWILPNRDQRDDLLASDGVTILPLKQIFDPARRPKGFSHGVPSEVLENCGPKAYREILFAQRFPGHEGGKEPFCVSCPAGVDATGRLVHLGLLFLLDRNERPRFDIPYANLSKEDQSYAIALLERLKSPSDPWAHSVRELSDLPTVNGPASNIAVHRSVVRFSSLYEAGPHGLTRRSAIWKKSLGTALVLILAGAVMAISIRACERSLHAEGPMEGSYGVSTEIK